MRERNNILCNWTTAKRAGLKDGWICWLVRMNRLMRLRMWLWMRLRLRLWLLMLLSCLLIGLLCHCLDARNPFVLAWHARHIQDKISKHRHEMIQSRTHQLDDVQHFLELCFEEAVGQRRPIDDYLIFSERHIVDDFGHSGDRV